jgi:hypothetical protein
VECGGEEENTQEMGEDERDSERRDLNDWDWNMECTPRTACDDERCRNKVPKNPRESILEISAWAKLITYSMIQ